VTQKLSTTGRGRENGDAGLVQRWKQGDERAAAALVARHSAALAQFAVRSGAFEEIDELVQETVVRAFASLDSFRGDSTLRTWLFSIQRNLLLDRQRAEQRDRRNLPINEFDAVTEFDALDAVIADETANRVRKAVERLSPTQKEVFMLRVKCGLSYRQIAEAVGSTEGSARVHYHNAIRSVKEFLGD
jgi:RNA polymerase sigma-70 factor (ECF subfamily)